MSTCPGAARGSGAAPGAARMALVRVRADERDRERAAGSARLVQDFGGPGDPAGVPGDPAPEAPPPPPPPARPPPPGSKTRKLA